MQEKLLKPKYSYCLDASALIDLNESYPIDLFKPLWSNLENIIKKIGHTHPAKY